MFQVVNIADREENPPGTLDFLKPLYHLIIWKRRLVHSDCLDHKDSLQYRVDCGVHHSNSGIREALKHDFLCIHRRLIRTAEFGGDTDTKDCLSLLHNRQEYIHIILHRGHGGFGERCGV